MKKGGWEEYEIDLINVNVIRRVRNSFNRLEWFASQFYYRTSFIVQGSKRVDGCLDSKPPFPIDIYSKNKSIPKQEKKNYNLIR